jgi:hypothetical protein
MADRAPGGPGNVIHPGSLSGPAENSFDENVFLHIAETVFTRTRPHNPFLLFKLVKNIHESSSGASGAEGFRRYVLENVVDKYPYLHGRWTHDDVNGIFLRNGFDVDVMYSDSLEIFVRYCYYVMQDAFRNIFIVDKLFGGWYNMGDSELFRVMWTWEKDSFSSFTQKIDYYFTNLSYARNVYPEYMSFYFRVMIYAYLGKMMYDEEPGLDTVENQVMLRDNTCGLSFQRYHLYDWSIRRLFDQFYSAVESFSIQFFDLMGYKLNERIMELGIPRDEALRRMLRNRVGMFRLEGTKLHQRWVDMVMAKVHIP